MKLYSCKIAPNDRKLSLYFKERNMVPPFERVEIDIMAGEQYSPEYLAMNPLGKIPILELEDGSFVTESLSIIEYFEELYPDSTMMGSNPQDRAKIKSIERFIDLEIMGTMGILAHQIIPLFANRFKKSQDVLDYGRTRQAMALAHLDDFIGEERSFVYGDTVSLADITLYATAESAFLVEAQIDSKYKNIIRCVESFSNRPSAKR